MRGRYVWCIARYEDGKTHDFSVPEDQLRRGDFILKSLADDNQRDGLLPPGRITNAQRGNLG
jgi:hypothetical protein